MITLKLRTPAWTIKLQISSKQQSKSSLKAIYESKTEFKIRNLIKMWISWRKFYQKLERFDQVLVQNTILDHTTEDISKQQSKSSTKAIYKSKMELKIRNLIKNVTKLTKILQKTLAIWSNPSSENQPGPYNCRNI